MANECMWCVDGELVEVERGKWRCNKCRAMHDQVVDKGGPGEQEKGRVAPALGQQGPGYVGLRRDGGHLTATEVVEARKKYAEDHPTPKPDMSPMQERIEAMIERITKPDAVNHPPHYTRHPAGIEVIEITEHEGFCLGNAIKYLLRAGVKGGKDKYVEDLEKAKWYVDREIHRFRREGNLSGWRAGLSCDS